MIVANLSNCWIVASDKINVNHFMTLFLDSFVVFGGARWCVTVRENGRDRRECHTGRISIVGLVKGCRLGKGKCCIRSH